MPDPPLGSTAMAQVPSRSGRDGGDDSEFSARSSAQPPQETASFPPVGVPLAPAPAGPAPEACPPPPDLADHPRYCLLEWLGGGGMGTVYKARHRLMDRLVALKVLNAGLVSRPTMAERFRREVRAAALLRHPNIV